ncbi:MAG TPA: ParB/RepB/Spo0J family partition protein, partial [Thermoanaerobaculia bacterium]|nr:ParB/RepB/Spo0J family partition protein [Thermoanaerobaculia bacterium]
MKVFPIKSAIPMADGVAHPLSVPRAALARDPHQPRQRDLGKGIDGLVESIRAHGIIQPILVRPHPDPAARAATPYMIVTGERRWTAAGKAGLDEVPVFLLDRPLSAAEILMLQIAENDGDSRQELSLLDLAHAVARAFRLEGGSQAQFATRHRRSKAWVSYVLSLARAQGLTAEALAEGRLRGLLVAHTFQRLTPEQQQELLTRARREGTAISLAAAEKIAGRADRRPRGLPAAGRTEPASPDPAASPAAPREPIAARGAGEPAPAPIAAGAPLSPATHPAATAGSSTAPGAPLCAVANQATTAGNSTAPITPGTSAAPLHSPAAATPPPDVTGLGSMSAPAPGRGAA